MTTQQWITSATEQLKLAGVTTARLDALILLEAILGIDRALILAEPSTEITSQQLAKLTNLLSRRTQHEPIAHLRGYSEFYGRQFFVSAAVLEPRPESEAIIEALVALPDLPQQPRIADVGTGSGALGITAALELPGARIELLDIDRAALQIAKRNVIKFATTATVKQSDLLQGSTKHYDVLLCNLPYVPDTYPINQAARYEPSIALFGGPDGLDLYRRLFEQLQIVEKKPLYIITEALPEQHMSLAELALHNGFMLRQTDDFVQTYKCR